MGAQISTSRKDLRTMKTKFGYCVLVSLISAFGAFAQSSSSINMEDATLVPANQVPTSGTFWVEQLDGQFLPYPSLPSYLRRVPIYALPEGGYVLDGRNVSYSASLASEMSPAGGFGPAPQPPSPPSDPPLVTSNAWFNQIIISNHTYVSLTGATLGTNGNVMTSQLPYGGMFAVTTTNLVNPQWQPVGQTNAIGNTNFSLPYLYPLSFYRICAQLNTNGNPDEILPFSVTASNISILTDQGVMLKWTNGQPGFAAEEDAIVELDTNGHSYLVGSVNTTKASGTFSFELQNATNLTFVRYTAPANTTTDQFFLATNYFHSPDVVTIPYVISTNSGRSIIEVAAYDVTDPSNPQFLGHVTGAGSEKGTLEIPGVSIWPGVDDLEFRAIDSGFAESATDFTITNYRLVSVVSPMLSLVPNGTNRVAASSGEYGIGFEAVTTATNGTWVVNVYDPAGNLFENGSIAVTNVGQVITFDDGSTVNSVYPSPYYNIVVTVVPPGNQPLAPNNPPAPVNTQYIRVYLLPPKPNAGSITGYDQEAIQALGNNSDEQYAIQVLTDGVSQMFAFVYQIENIQNNGYWQTVGSPMANSLNVPWGWTALNYGLAGEPYYPGNISPQQTPDRPILGVMVHGHGGLNPAGVALGVQGPSANDQLSQESLEEAGFNKATNAVAMAIFTGCRIGGGPFMQYILRNNGVSGQFSPSTAATQKIRPCFGLGWTIDKPNNTDVFDWLTYFTLYATENDGSTFTYTLDQAVSLANQNAPGSGGNGVLWSGEQGITPAALSQ
jgi:hypothetical protein